MEGLYKQPKTCDWRKIQRLALEDDSDSEIRSMVLSAQRLSVRMPVIRKVIKPGKFLGEDRKTVLLTVKEGETIICDVASLPYNPLISDYTLCCYLD